MFGAGELEVERDTGDVAAKADGEGVGFLGWDLTGSIEEHFPEGPAYFGILDFVNGLERVCEAFGFGFFKNFFRAVETTSFGIFEP